MEVSCSRYCDKSVSRQKSKMLKWEISTLVFEGACSRKLHLAGPPM